MPFEIGQKVVPISKSFGCAIGLSGVWAKAKEKHQPFLFIRGFEHDGVICCHFCNHENSGDFFLPSDLIPYEETNVHGLHLLAKEL